MALCSALVLAVSALGASAVSMHFKQPSSHQLTNNASQRMGLVGLCGPQAKFTRSTTSAAYFWSNKNRDASCTGAAPFSAPSKLSAGPSWSWKDETASIVSVHPCIDSEKSIYLSNRNGAVRKFSRDGTLLWENKEVFAGQVSQPLVGGCVIHEGSLYVGTTLGTVLSIDMQSGRTNWLVRASDSAGSDSWSLIAHNGIVLTPGRGPRNASSGFDMGGNELLVALDARDGTKLWTSRFQNPTFNFIGSFVDGPPSVIFSDMFGIPHRVALCDGNIMWRNAEGRQVHPSLMSTGGAIVEPGSGLAFVTGNLGVPPGVLEGTVTAYDVKTGALVWRHQSPMPANNAPVVGKLREGSDGLSVVVAVGQNPGFPDAEAERTGFYKDGTPVAWKSHIFALDARTGVPTGWEYTPEVYRRPAAYGDSFPYHICLPDSWSNAAIGGDGSVYIGHMSGRIFALRDANGDGALSKDQGEVSSFFGHRCYQGSPGLAPGMLVATPCDGMHVFNM